MKRNIFVLLSIFILTAYGLNAETEIKVQLGHSSRVTSVTFSPDGQYALSGAYKTLKLWDIASGKEIKSFSGRSFAVNAVAFSPNSKYALSGSYKTLELWDIASGRLIRTFSGHSHYVRSVAISPDGKYVLSGSDDHSLKLWDISTGKEIRSMTGHSRSVYSVAFSSDSKYALSGSSDNTIKLWDISSGKEIRSFSGHSKGVSSVAFSPDGKYALSGSDDDTLKLWDISSGRLIRTFSGHSGNVNSVAFSPDGTYALSGLEDHTIKLWDISKGKEVRSFIGHSKEVSSVAFSPDGKYALSGSADDTLKLWDIESGRLIRTFTGHTNNVNSVAFSPDGTYALSGALDDTLKLWDISSGKEIRTFTGHDISVNSVVFSPDGNHILSGGLDKTLKLWDLSNGKEIRSFAGHSQSVSSVAFSPDGKYALSGSKRSLKLWDISSGKEIRSFSGYLGWVSSVAFSPDGAYALSGGENGALNLWDISSGKEIRSFSGHLDWVRSVSFSSNGKYVLSGSKDSTIKYWDIATGELIYSAIASPDGRSLAWTPEGYFTGDERLAKEAVYILDGMTVIGIDQLFDTYFRPDIVAAKIKGEDITRYVQNDLRLGIKLPPTVEISIKTTHGSFSSFRSNRENDYVITNGTIQVKVSATDEGGGISGLRLFNNGKVVGENLRGLAIVDTSQSLETVFTIPLENGENHLRAIGFSQDRTESAPAIASVEYESPVQVKPNMYIVAIGINEYLNSRYNLNYCVADMNGFVKELKPRAERLFNMVDVVTISDRNATRANVLNIFNNLEARVEPEDVFIFFFAGHGIALDVQQPDGKMSSEFYYILADVVQMTDPSKVAAEGISGTEMREIISSIKATKQVAFIDACYAGAITEQFAMRGAAEENALARLSRSTGSVIFASTTADQEATEFKDLNHGVFTFVVLEAIKGAGATQSGQLTAASIKAYVDEKLPEYTKKYRGTPQWPTTFMWGQDFPIGLK